MKRFLRRGILIFTFNLFSLYSLNANVITIQNPGNNVDIQPAITAVLTNAVNGDIIVLPAGTFIVSKSIVVTKFISFRGAGIGKTILYRDKSVSDNTLTNDAAWDGIIKFNINKNTSSNIKVTGITFRSKYPSVVAGDGGSLAIDVGIKFINCIDFVVSQCRFEYFGNGAIEIFHRDTLASGLIFKNEFYHNHKGADGSGFGYGVVVYGENKQWVKNPKLGTKNFIFIEDNTFTLHRHAIASGGSALYVARYNKFTNNLLEHTIDTHNTLGGSNLGTENYFGTRAVEVYHNEIINTLNSDGSPVVSGQPATKLTENAIKMRAGDAIVYNNKIVGFRFAVGISTGGLDESKLVYPLRSQPGYLSAVQLGVNHKGIDSISGNGDLFCYNNTFTPWPGTISSSNFYNYLPKLFVDGRDYHLTSKPGYKPYTYPHPLGNLITTDDQGFNEYDSEELAVYPNPANTITTISFPVKLNRTVNFTIYDTSGRVAYKHTPMQMPLGNQSFTFDVSTLENGIYFISLSIGEITLNKKLLVIR